MARVLTFDPASVQRPDAPPAARDIASDGIADSASWPFSVDGSTAVTQRLRQHLLRTSGYAALSLDGCTKVLLDFAGERAFLPLLAEAVASSAPLARTMGENFDRVVLEELSCSHFAALASDGLHYPLRPFLWQVALHNDAGSDVDEPLSNGARVRLLRWPDFRLLGHQHDGFRLCSLLLKRSCTLTECQQLLDLGDGAVRTFVRATYFCGYSMIEPPRADEARTPPAASSRGGVLLARMWRSLRGTVS